MDLGDEDEDARLEGRLGAMHEGSDYRRIEVITGRRARRTTLLIAIATPPHERRLCSNVLFNGRQADPGSILKNRR